jgi:hypothetical protein
VLLEVNCEAARSVLSLAAIAAKEITAATTRCARLDAQALGDCGAEKAGLVMDDNGQLQQQNDEAALWECLGCNDVFVTPVERSAWNSDIEPLPCCPYCGSDEIEELQDVPF